jgi:dihydrofolate reductase
MRELAAWRRDAGKEGGVVNASTTVYEEGSGDVGAIIMGRNMFGGGPGPWGDPPWMGWWGEEPPFRMPVFVLTHYPRPPLQCRGGTTFMS